MFRPHRRIAQPPAPTAHVATDDGSVWQVSYRDEETDHERVLVRLSPDAAARLDDLANSANVSRDEIVDRALYILALLAHEQAGGVEVLLHDPRSRSVRKLRRV